MLFRSSTAVWVVALSTLPPMIVFAMGVGHVFPELRKREWIGGAMTSAATIGAYFLLR